MGIGMTIVKREWLGRVWRDWVRPIAVILVICGSFRSAVADWNDVPTGSMKPTILEGDRIFVNKLAYDLKVPFTTWPILEWGVPRRGDVVICYAPDSNERLVKRVVAVPGDTIAMRANRLFINGEPAVYDLLDADTLNQIDARSSTRLKVKNTIIAQIEYLPVGI